jgi:hypothetical protein
MRTRRGVERQQTGDEDILSDMMFHHASINSSGSSNMNHDSTSKDIDTSTTETFDLNDDLEDDDVEDDDLHHQVVQEQQPPRRLIEQPKKKKELCTRRGVRRQATGDSDQLGLMLYGNSFRSENVKRSDTIPIEIATTTTTTTTTSSSENATTSTTSSDTSTSQQHRRRGRRQSSVTKNDDDDDDVNTDNCDEHHQEPSESGIDNDHK